MMQQILLGLGAVDLLSLPFEATGGTKIGPSGGYYYHVFEASGSPHTFTVSAGSNPVAVAVVGGGGAGGSGGPPSGDEAGSGGSGGSTRIATIGLLIPGTSTVTVGSGGPSSPYPPDYNAGAGGGPTTFAGPPDYSGTISAGGGSGGIWYQPTYPGSAGSGSWPSAPSFTNNQAYTGGGGQTGDNRPAHPSRTFGPSSGGYGGNAGHYGQSSGWWSPYINPGKGGYSPSPFPGGTGINNDPGKSGNSISATTYGGGGGGGGKGGPGGSGANGRVVVRYPDAPGL